MYTILLCIIYLAFISLGLPDALLGSAWPVMHQELSMPVSAAGIVTMIIAGGTIVSSLLSDRLTRKLGAGVVTAVSVGMTAAALFGFSMSDSFWMLCVWAIPYGLGAGAVDAALNNYVALHFASRHMNWLHCFWGMGASISPYIMSFSLTKGYGWNHGYFLVGVLQAGLTVILCISLPLWKKLAKREEKVENKAEQTAPLRLSEVLRIPGVICVLLTFFAYCAVEQTSILWASSYLVQYRGVEVSVAAQFASLFLIGITFGRFLCGFIADKFGDRVLIRYGMILVVAGFVLVALPLQTDVLALAGLVLAGFGCAPVYPAIIHSTPDNFGADKSQAVIGIQMASAYVGTTFMPPLFGLLAAKIGIFLLPFYLLAFAAVVLVMSERLNRMKQN